MNSRRSGPLVAIAMVFAVVAGACQFDPSALEGRCKVIRTFAKDSDINHGRMLPAHGGANGTGLFRRQLFATNAGADLLGEEQRLLARNED